MDGAWIICFMLAVLLSMRPDRWIAWPLLGLVAALTVSRLLLGLFWGLVPPMVETVLLISVVLVALICLIRKPKLRRAD